MRSSGRIFPRLVWSDPQRQLERSMVARFIDVGAPLSAIRNGSPLLSITSIPEHMIRSGEVAKWNTTLELADVRRFGRPVPTGTKAEL